MLRHSTVGPDDRAAEGRDLVALQAAVQVEQRLVVLLRLAPAHVGVDELLEVADPVARPPGDSPDALVGELSGGQRQGVAIARAMHFKSKVLILDEPTNHLSVKETDKVIGFVRDLKRQNVTGLFISHNMHHVFQCCDRIVAMARGEIVFDKPTRDTSIDEVHGYL